MAPRYPEYEANSSVRMECLVIFTWKDFHTRTTSSASFSFPNPSLGSIRPLHTQKCWLKHTTDDHRHDDLHHNLWWREQFPHSWLHSRNTLQLRRHLVPGADSDGYQFQMTLPLRWVAEEHVQVKIADTPSSAARKTRGIVHPCQRSQGGYGPNGSDRHDLLSVELEYGSKKINKCFLRSTVCWLVALCFYLYLYSRARRDEDGSWDAIEPSWDVSAGFMKPIFCDSKELNVYVGLERSEWTCSLAGAPSGR